MTLSYLVTGASTGIGEACALDLDQLGHRVFAGVRKPVDADRLLSRSSDRLVPVTLDVTSEEQIDQVAKEIDAAVGARGLDGVVNNAGIGLGGPLEFLALDEWRTQLEVNVVGQVAVTKAMLPLIRRATGRIVFIGSVAGRVATPLMGPYNASKHAIEAIGETLRHELRGFGIKVIVVEPGAIATEIWTKGHQTVARLEADMPAEAQELYGDQIAALKAGLELQDQRGIPARRVADVVQKALLSPRPRARYLVGPDAKAAGVLSRVAPDSAKDAVVSRVTRRS
jgi:NAD(P)-dependent dehydrogenase (short-subunit alcohol dehydrogenase family)